MSQPQPRAIAHAGPSYPHPSPRLRLETAPPRRTMFDFEVAEVEEAPDLEMADP
jgi:hypothetical protein